MSRVTWQDQPSPQAVCLQSVFPTVPSLKFLMLLTLKKHQGFSRQEHCSGLPFPSPMHESEK